jgi:hypothetical protein
MVHHRLIDIDTDCHFDGRRDKDRNSKIFTGEMYLACYADIITSSTNRSIRSRAYLRIYAEASQKSRIDFLISCRHCHTEEASTLINE